VLARAAAAGVDTVIVIGYDAPSSRRAIEVAHEFGVASDAGSVTAGDLSNEGIRDGGVRLFATAGVAPHHVLETDDQALEAVRATLDDDLVVAVGEIGLDYHYDMPPDAQRALFARQLAWATELDMPVVIHSREAEQDVLASLREQGCSRGVIHCFTEGPKMAEGAVEIGLYVSFAGIITFKNAQDLRDIAAAVPLARMLIETDSPYLAPVPYRGKRNEPGFVVEVARMIAELHGTSVDEVERITTQNARDLFGF
jgi:TatD DNase family protein